jgi:membrane-associated phospholipid phosphatase
MKGKVAILGGSGSGYWVAKCEKRPFRLINAAIDRAEATLGGRTNLFMQKAAAQNTSLFPSGWIRRAGFAALCLALFVGLCAILQSAGPTNPWDQGLDMWLRSFRTSLLDELMIFATYLCSWQVIVSGALVAEGWLLLHRRRIEAVALLVSLLGNQAIVSSVKLVMHRARPDQLTALVPAAGLSFPSGHVFSAFAFYGFLALLALRTSVPRGTKSIIVVGAVLLILVVALSRVYVGAHWPSDVLGSILLGPAWLSVIDIGLIVSARRFPQSAVQPTYKSRSSVWLFAAVWLVFIIGFAYLQPAARQSGAIALLVDNGALSAGHG